jgi:DNA sulfur modification protein DndB
LAHNVVEGVKVFKDMTETAKSTISNRSRKLFTLSSIYQANCKLLGDQTDGAVPPEIEKLIIDFWNEVAKFIPDWTLAAQRKATPSELRRDFVHAHGVALRALSYAGVELLAQPAAVWKKQLKGLEKIDWSRSNAKVWEGRAMVAGKISKAHNNIILSANIIKNALGLPLNPKEEEIEMLYSRGKL